MSPSRTGLFERSYEDNAILQKGFNAQIVDDFIAYILRVCPEAKWRPIKILDLCCGDGAVTEAIFKKCIKAGILIKGMMGCDISPEQIDVATEKYGKRFSELTFRCQDALEMTDENEFDVVICSFGMHWFSEIDTIARVMEKVIKPGGKLVCFTPLEKTQFFSMRSELVASPKWAQHFEGFALRPFIDSPDRYVNAFSTAFKMENEGGIRGTQRVDFAHENFKKFLSSWMQELRHLPLELRDDYLNDLLGKLPRSEKGVINDVEINTDGMIQFYERFSWIHAESKKVLTHAPMARL